MFNPVDPRLITTANSKEGAALWDIRVSDKYVPYTIIIFKFLRKEIITFLITITEY